MLSLYKLEIFALVVQEGSFSSAAERLYLSQSAVSQHIQDLEASLGTRLFKRGRRGVTLTPSGDTLYGYTRRILQLVAEAESAVTDVDSLKAGQVRVGATPGVNIYILPGWVREFQTRFPHLKIALQTDITPQIVADVLAHRLDIGFVEGEIENARPARLGSVILQEISQFVVIGKGHPWCQHESVPIEALHGQAFVARQQNSQTRAWIDQILARYNVKPRIIAEFDNPESIKHMVLSGMGVTILPEYAIHNERANRQVRALPLEDVPLQRTLKLVWDEQIPLMPVTRAFLGLLTGQFPQLLKLIQTGNTGTIMSD